MVIEEDRSLYPRRFYKNVSTSMAMTLQQMVHSDTINIPTGDKNLRGESTSGDDEVIGKGKKIGIESIKAHDYCFIGAYRIDADTRRNRQWIIPFIQKYFTNESFLQFTDDKTKNINQITGQSSYRPMGSYDYTLRRKGFVPKYIKEKIKNRNFFDTEYFATMSKCRFCLAPAGDRFYSMRFLEALMTKCIPIVKSKREVFRSRREAAINYYYYLAKQVRKEKGILKYKESWVDINFETFLRHHTLEYFPQVDDDVYNVNDEKDDINNCPLNVADYGETTCTYDKSIWKKGHASLVRIWDD